MKTTLVTIITYPSATSKYGEVARRLTEDPASPNGYVEASGRGVDGRGWGGFNIAVCQFIKGRFI